MRIETSEAYDFSFSDFNELCDDVGFSKMYHMPLTAPTSAAIALKQLNNHKIFYHNENNTYNPNLRS
ncbi:hypothetical protein [Subsaximicrobium wynnwilliamsii]|uniref:hypothetical protein n=1 Tax=Subsaximicrobium wynnwilliamsii TaxID=291179 RepID=UPI001676DD72|nr:hypothetical protein [Subsaximicrobium wynnwilliamsii]